MPNYQTRRAAPVETTRWSVEANITAYKRQTSGGYRMTLEDADGSTMIAVAQDPSVLKSASPLSREMAAAVRKLTSRFKFRPRFIKTEVPVRVVGIGFFNRWHAQSAGAPNVLELQPLLDIEFPIPDRPITPQALTQEVTFRGVPAFARAVDQTTLRRIFAELNPNLKLTRIDMSLLKEGEVKIVARIEAPPGFRDFDKVARETFNQLVARVAKRTDLREKSSKITKATSKARSVSSRRKPPVTSHSKKAAQKTTAKSKSRKASSRKTPIERLTEKAIRRAAAKRPAHKKR